MKLVPVIGLETHVQLKTKTKMFCPCSAHGEALSANTNVCPICLGHPGSLPVPNEQAIRWAILIGLSLNGQITPHSKFDRKNYFYPDLPKGYQISQFDLPVMHDGSITLEVAGAAEPVTIGIERLHLEEDAAKNIHGDDGKTYVDYNRGGTPLCEIVTKPDFHSALEAKTYLQELRLLVRTLGVSEGDMEKGHLRCDVNISLREVLEDGSLGPLHPKSEIKNVNSFRMVERAIEYEIKRQTELWEQGQPPAITTTRGWNDAKGRTEEQRTKEEAADYRYFPEPDIPPMELAELAEEIRMTIPELPWNRRRRLVTEYGFKIEDARQMVDDPALADYAEQTMSELGAWLEADVRIERDEVPEHQKKMAKLVSGWLLNKLLGELAKRGGDIRTMKITPENFAEFVKLIGDGKLTGTKGLEVLNRMLDDGINPSQAMEELGASRLDDVTALAQIIDSVIERSANEVARYRAGEVKLMQWFVGQVMKESRGNADPDTTAKILAEKFKS
jgi:aspartyl-tRNA(Asn)/glutamyl-tRNA(Gln) amidotransferase subunit B